MATVKNKICNVCLKFFRGPAGLAEHQWRVHEIAKPVAKKGISGSSKSEITAPKIRPLVICTVCNGKVLEKNIKRHLRELHPGTRLVVPFTESIKAVKLAPDQDRPYRCQCGGLVRPSMSLIHQKAGHAHKYTEGYRYPDPLNELPERNNESSVHAWSGGLPGLGKRH